MRDICTKVIAIIYLFFMFKLKEKLLKGTSGVLAPQKQRSITVVNKRWSSRQRFPFCLGNER